MMTTTGVVAAFEPGFLAIGFGAPQRETIRGTLIPINLRAKITATL
jgi:hypothetical protein